LALSPSAAANRRIGLLNFKPEITPLPIPTNFAPLPRHGGATLSWRLMFASACAVLPFLVALILARLIAKSDLEVSSKAVTAFQANLEIFWILSLMIVTLVE
jgi:hypothetical protein